MWPRNIITCVVTLKWLQHIPEEHGLIESTWNSPAFFVHIPFTDKAVYKTQQRGLTLTCTESTNKFSPSDRDAETDVGQVNVKPAGGHRVTGETASFFFFLITRFWIGSTVGISLSTKNLIGLYCLQRTYPWLKGGLYGKITVKQTCADVKTSINQSCERETWPLTRKMRHLTTQTEQCNFDKRWHSWEKCSKNSGL